MKRWWMMIVVLALTLCLGRAEDAKLPDDVEAFIRQVQTLGRYEGPVEIFGATGDTIIPIEHAKALAGQIRGARFTAISGGHNEWSVNDELKITR